MAAKKKPAAKSSQPKFGSPAWFARYPKAAAVKNRAKGRKGK